VGSKTGINPGGKSSYCKEKRKETRTMKKEGGSKKEVWGSESMRPGAKIYTV